MSEAVLERGAEALEGAPRCRHHWVIASPSGTMSVGRCRRCGAVREFRNSTPEYYYWGEEPPSSETVMRRPAAEEDEEGFSLAEGARGEMAIAL
jgi:hypothetical protein